jgi:type VI secretion system protein ImpM
MSARALTPVPGWYGKLPSLGDFATRRLPESFVRVWDDWLMRGLAAARESRGAYWLHQVRMDAPARRFWLGPGVVGTHCWFGVLLPSLDRVGRRFPLTFAASLREAETPARCLAQALAARQWFQALDGVARAAIESVLPVEVLEDDLSEVGAVAIDAAEAGMEELAGRLLQRAGAAESTEESDATLPPVMHDGEVCALSGSVWWLESSTAGSDFRCFGSLPPPDALASLLAPR